MKRIFKILLTVLFVSVGVTGVAQTYGLTGVHPVWAGNTPPQDGVGVRFKFYVADNNSNHLKILFSDSRLCGSQLDTYLLEYNLYDEGLRFDDWVYTTWPMQGTHVSGESSLRVAVPDYVAAGKTGAKTYSPEMFPRQTYEIDGIVGLWKTDLISQTNMNRQECRVTMIRGDLVTDLSGWRPDGTDLPADTYRQWSVTVEFGQATYEIAFALPDGNASYLDPWETLIFFTEFLHTSGLLRVYFWDFQLMRESSGIWEHMYRWRVSHHDGSLNSFGIRKASHNGKAVIEISNDPAMNYLPPETIIDIAPTEEKVVLFLEAHDPLWTNQTEDGLADLCTLLDEEGITWAVHEQGALTSGDIDSVDVLVVGYSSQAFETAECDLIEDFVRDGGGLLLMGEGWSWPGDISAFPLNQLASRFGWIITARGAGDPVELLDHPILAGVASLCFAGSSPIDPTASLDAVVLDPRDETLVVATVVDEGRVVVIGDSDVFTNIDYDEDGISMLDEADNTVLAVNTFRWLGQLDTNIPGWAVFRVDEMGNVFSDGAFYGEGFLLGAADVAEWVSVSEPVEPGDALELDPTSPGQYRKAWGPCSTLIAGVVSSNPGVILGSESQTPDSGLVTEDSALLALIGIVAVKVTNEGGPIQPGDLLTTSSVPGYAMRCNDPKKCQGAIIGKALEPLEEGIGVIKMLVMQ